MRTVHAVDWIIKDSHAVITFGGIPTHLFFPSLCFREILTLILSRRIHSLNANLEHLFCPKLNVINFFTFNEKLFIEWLSPACACQGKHYILLHCDVLFILHVLCSDKKICPNIDDFWCLSTGNTWSLQPHIDIQDLSMKSMQMTHGICWISLLNQLRTTN